MAEALIVDCETQEETRRDLTSKEVAQQKRDAELATTPSAAGSLVVVDPAALAQATAAVADASTVEDLRAAVQVALGLLAPDAP